MSKINWTPKIKLNASGVTVMANRPGMFKLIYLNPETNRYKQFYVARTENLKKELAQHLPWRERDLNLAFYLRKYQCYFQAVETNEVIMDKPEVEERSFGRFLRMLVGTSAQVSYR